MSGPRPRRRAKARTWALAALSVLVLGYLLVVAGAYTFQRRMLYFPDPARYDAQPGLQELRLKATDGETLVAWWLPPTAGKPTMLFFGGNGDSLIGEAGRFSACGKEGVGMLSVAYEGYSGSTGHPTETALHQDAEVAYAWLAQRVPPADIVIHGFSLGSGVAVQLAARHPARALILEAPYTSTVDVGVERMPWLPVRLLMWDRFESRKFIGQVHMPLLIAHGDADQTVPFHFGQELFALANPPKTFVRFPGGTHNGLVQLGLYDHIWRFLGLPAA